MNSKSRLSMKSGSHQGREQHGYPNNMSMQYTSGPVNHMSLSNSPQKDAKHVTGKSFQTQTNFKMQSQNTTGSVGSGSSHPVAGPHGSLSHQTYNQQRILQGGIQMSVSMQHKTRSQKGSKGPGHSQQSAGGSMGSGQNNFQYQQIQLVNNNQYVSANNSNQNRLQNTVGNQQYQTQHHNSQQMSTGSGPVGMHYNQKQPASDYVNLDQQHLDNYQQTHEDDIQNHSRGPQKKQSSNNRVGGVHGSASNTSKHSKKFQFNKIDSSQNLNNYDTEQQVMQGKSMAAHASPPPVSQYYQKMNTNDQNQLRSQKHSMIQPPHFIKVKSKTNNPTRKNSPGINQRSGHGSMHAQQQQQLGSGGIPIQNRGIRDSNNSHILAKQREIDGSSSTGPNHNTEIDGDTPVKISFTGNGIPNIGGKSQMLSQQNSPNKVDGHMLDRSGINQMYANSMVENDMNRKQTLKNNLMVNEKLPHNNSPGMSKNAMGFIDIDPNSQLSASGTSHSLYQKSSKVKNLGLANQNPLMKQSVDLRLLNIQKMQGKIIKGQSSKDILNHKDQQAHAGAHGSNDQISNKMNDRGSVIGNSPGTGVIAKKGQRVDSSSGHGGSTAPLGGLQSHHSTTQSAKANHLSQIGQITLEPNAQKQLDQAQQQKKYLNMVVQKKIGGIASGKQRRENRNQMMKNNQQLVFTDNKSAVGSIGSIGSLGPFMGVQEIGYQGHGTETYDASLNSQGQNMMMKFPIDTKKVNKTNGDQKFQQYQKYSQLQQMHLNNVNPMHFSMTEHLPGPSSKVGQTQQQLGSYSNEDQFGAEQHMNTMGHNNVQSLVTNQIDTSCNRSLKPNQKQIFYRQNEQNYRTQTNPNYENQSLTGSGHGPSQAQGKTQVIQMRKINPISKTAQTASKNTSIDMKKNSNNMQMHNRVGGAAGLSQTQPMHGKNQGSGSVYSQSNNVYHQGNAQIQPPKILGGPQGYESNVYSKTSQQKYGSQKGQKAYSNTAKVSLNNTPKGTKKLIGQGLHAASQHSNPTGGRGTNSTVPMQFVGQGGHMANNNQKPQQQLRQQPIGQPMGDIPVKHDNKPDNLTQPSQMQVQEFNALGSPGMNQPKGNMAPNKKHHYAQSVLLDEQQLHGRGQPTGKHPFSKSIIQQIPSPQANMVDNPQDFDANAKQSMTQKPQSKSTMGGMSTHLASNTSSGIVHGKVKLKVVSENSSPPAELGGLLHTQTQGSTFNQTQNMSGQQMNISNNQKSANKTKNTSMAGSNNGSVGKSNQMNYTTINNIRQGKKLHKHSAQSSGAYSKMSATGGGTMTGGMAGPLNSPPNALGNSVNRRSLNKNDSNNLRRSSAAPSSSSNTLKNSTRAGNKTGGASADPAKKSFQTTKGSSKNKNEMGQQYINQYFKQKKNIVGQVVQGNESSHTTSHHQRSTGQTSQQVFAFAKFSQIDSPKDSSIERARQNDMLIQEAAGRDSAVMQMNQHLKNVVSVDLPEEFGGQQETNHGGNKVGDRNTDLPANANQQYILKNIERGRQNPSQLSPRSKEVYLIRQLIMDCFRKYEKPPKTQLELYKIGKMLGKGAFGKVNLGLHRLTRKLCAIKSINMDFMKEESQKKKIMNEINILKSLRHPNNIKILETFQTDKHHMIVMELCPGGDLLNYVRKRRKLSEKYAKFVFKQIMEGIAYLHENKVAHRDIKLDNILLDGHGNIKIGDFGVSRKIEENEILFEQCGTPAYIAPEIVKDMGYKGFPVDIWSAGICLYAMLYGNVPFKANQIGDLNTVEQLNQDIEYKDTVSKQAIDVMKMMLQKVPKQRATAQDVLLHSWLTEDVDEHIDIFDEQELELIRKEFTYVLQKKKLRDFQEQKEKLKQRAIESPNESGELPAHLASRRPDDLNTEFTECSIQTHENSLMKNDSSRSVILCPFNTQTGDKTAEKIIKQAAGLMEDKDVMIRFHPRVRELDRNYEKLNNQDFDNGVYHKYAYKQKAKADGAKEGEKEGQGKDGKDEGLKEESIKQSDVQMNNLVSTKEQRQQQAATGAAAETARKRRREKADINYHNYYIKINQNVISDTARLGFPRQYIEKCLRDNANNHCTTTYYLLCMDQNF